MRRLIALLLLVLVACTPQVDDAELVAAATCSMGGYIDEVCLIYDNGNIELLTMSGGYKNDPEISQFASYISYHLEVAQSHWEVYLVQANGVEQHLQLQGEFCKSKGDFVATYCTYTVIGWVSDIELLLMVWAGNGTGRFVPLYYLVSDTDGNVAWSWEYTSDMDYRDSDDYLYSVADYDSPSVNGTFTVGNTVWKADVFNDRQVVRLADGSVLAFIENDGYSTDKEIYLTRFYEDYSEQVPGVTFRWLNPWRR